MVIKTYQAGDVYKEAAWRENVDLAIKDQVYQTIPSVSVYNDKDEIVIILGASVFSPGVGFATFMVNDRIKDDPKEVSTIVTEAMSVYVGYHHIRKIYALVSAAKPVDMKWVERYGFTEEYRMLQAGLGGEDLIGYSLMTGFHVEPLNEKEN